MSGRPPGFMGRTLAIARKELIQLRRDRILPRLIVIFPLGLLIFFGYAISFTVRDLPLAALDESVDSVSTALLRSLEAGGRFSLREAASLDQALALVKSGAARAALVIPAGALAAAREARPVEFTVYLDGSDPTVGVQIRGAAQDAIQELSARLAAVRALTGQAYSPLVVPRFEILFNPEERSAVYMVPGLVGLILSQICVLLTAVVVVREREVGTMETLLATPARPHEVVIGKVLPYLVVSVVVAGLVLVTGMIVFGVPLAGDPLALAAAAGLFVLGSLGVGILISTMTSTQIQAVFGTFLYFFPSLFLSGAVFPLEGMEPFFRAVSAIVPLRYFIEVARGVMIRGTGFESHPVALLALAGFALVALAAATARFRRTL